MVKKTSSLRVLMTQGLPQFILCSNYLMSCEIYTPSEGPDGMLLERNGKLTMWKSKSSRLPYSLVESWPQLFVRVAINLENMENLENSGN